MEAAISNRAKPIRSAVLATLGVLVSLAILALLPSLLRQTSFRPDDATLLAARLIPLIPEAFIEPREPLDISEPEPPPEPELPEPEVEPPELPEVVPPEMEMPELEPPEADLEPAPMDPPQAAQIETPSISAISVNSLPVRSIASAVRSDISVSPKPLRASMPRAQPQFKPPPKPPQSDSGAGPDKVDHPPEPISTMHPVYPHHARRLGIEGRVTVSLLVDKTGKVGKARIEEADPDGVFEASVEKTVSRWRFKPAQKDGRPVEMWVKMDIEFKF